MRKTLKEMEESIANNLQKNTGKNLQEWIEAVKKSGSKDRKRQIEWLEIRHGLGNGQAKNITRMMYEGLADFDESDLLTTHFGGEKDFQKPIYDKIIAAVKKWGTHKLTVNKTYLSLINHHQFAILKTIKEGLVMGVPAFAVKTGKSKEFVQAKNLGGEKITHKIILHDVTDVNESVMKVLKASYDKC